MCREVDQNDLRTLGLAWILARTREFERNVKNLERKVESFFLFSLCVFRPKGGGEKEMRG